MWTVNVGLSFGISEQPELALKSKVTLKRLRLGMIDQGFDGFRGLPLTAGFDGISKPALRGC